MEIKQLLSNFQVRSKCTSPYFSYIGLPNKRILFLEIVVNILIYLFRVVEKCSRNSPKPREHYYSSFCMFSHKELNLSGK